MMAGLGMARTHPTTVIIVLNLAILSSDHTTVATHKRHLANTTGTITIADTMGTITIADMVLGTTIPDTKQDPLLTSAGMARDFTLQGPVHQRGVTPTTRSRTSRCS